MIPFKFACEMVCDMIAASKVYKGKDYTLLAPLNYFEAQNYSRFVHADIQKFMRAVFTAYSVEGNKAINKENFKKWYKENVG